MPAEEDGRSRFPAEGTGGERVGTVLIGLMLLAACGGDGSRTEAPTGERPTVLVSVPPQAWLAERVAGDLVDVRVMVPPGASPKSYEPTMSQMREVHRAALYAALGHPQFPFERAWLGELREAAGEMTVVDTGAGCQRTGGDPHIWLDPDCALRMADSLEAALGRLLPDDRDAVAEGARAARERVRAVREEVGRALEPHRGRSFMVFHPAWGHFARAFGLRQVAIEARGQDPSPAELQRLVRRATDERIGVVFVQPQFSTEAAGLVADEVGARLVTLDPLGRDWDRTLLVASGELRTAFETDDRTVEPAGAGGP